MTDWHSPLPTVLVAFTLVPSHCPLESPHLVDIDLHYRWFLFSSFTLSGSLFARDIKCFRIWVGLPPQRGNIFQHFFSPYAHLLVSWLIPEKIVEIHSELPKISPILKWGGGLSQKGVTYFNIFSPNVQHPS